MPTATTERVLLTDLNLPATVRRQVVETPCRSGIERELLRERLLLRHHFGGSWIATVDTERGPAVVARVVDGDGDVFDAIAERADLTPEERRTLRIEFIDGGPSSNAEVQTPFPVHEER